MGGERTHTETQGEENLENGVRAPQPPRQTILMLAAPLLPAEGHLLPRPWLSSVGVHSELSLSVWKLLLLGTRRDLGNNVICPTWLHCDLSGTSDKG